MQQGILGKLEKRTFLSLHELNEAIKKELATWKDKPFQKLASSRRRLFDEIERPALKGLPREHFEFAEWCKAKVHIDYHIQVEKHFYSIPYQLVGKEVEVRLTRNTIEIFSQGERVASHYRNPITGRFTTLKEHMPMHHRRLHRAKHRALPKRGREDWSLDSSVCRRSISPTTWLQDVPRCASPGKEVWSIQARVRLPESGSGRWVRLQNT